MAAPKDRNPDGSPWVPEVEMWCDGASAGSRDQPGGWAYVLKHVKSKHRVEASGHIPCTTNNRAELTAAIRGLQAFKRPTDVRVYCDSNNVCQTANQWMYGWRLRGWKKADGVTEPTNLDLVKQLHDLVEAFNEAGKLIRFVWVKGHDGDVENERCDELAVAAKNATEEWANEQRKGRVQGGAEGSSEPTSP